MKTGLFLCSRRTVELHLLRISSSQTFFYPSDTQNQGLDGRMVRVGNGKGIKKVMTYQINTKANLEEDVIV